MQQRAVKSALSLFELREFVAKPRQMTLDLAHGDGDSHRARYVAESPQQEDSR